MNESKLVKHGFEVHGVFHGSFSQVYSILEKTSRRRLAAKITDSEKELLIWKSILRHPNIMALEEIHRVQDLIVLTSELMHGSLLDLLKNPPKFQCPWGKNLSSIAVPEFHVRDIAIQISQGLHSLHYESEIVHRDLKLENILMTLNFKNNKVYEIKIKITDFNLSENVHLADPNLTCGSLEYCPPESLTKNQIPKEKQKQFILSQDLWSLGICLHTLKAGKMPYFIDPKDTIFPPRRMSRIKLALDSGCQFEVFDFEAFNGHSKLCEANEKVSPELKEVLDHLLCPWDKRFEAQQVFKVLGSEIHHQQISVLDSCISS